MTHRKFKNIHRVCLPNKILSGTHVMCKLRRRQELQESQKKNNSDAQNSKDRKFIYKFGEENVMKCRFFFSFVYVDGSRCWWGCQIGGLHTYSRLQLPTSPQPKSNICMDCPNFSTMCYNFALCYCSQGAAFTQGPRVTHLSLHVCLNMCKCIILSV